MPLGRLLALRDLGLVRRSWNVFDDVYRSMIQAEADLDRMQRHVFRLLPREFAIRDSESCVEGTPKGENRGEGRERSVGEVVEESGIKKLKLNFDVKGFKPELIKVKLLNDNMLKITADSEHEGENGSYERRVYEHHYSLPKGTDLSNIRPLLTKDGVLTIETVLPQTEQQIKEKEVPIEKMQE